MAANPHCIFTAATLLAAVALGGCTEVRCVKVTEKNPNPAGLRYSLPTPVIRAVPQGDGTLDVGVEYLPDESHTYAIATSSYFSSHKVEIQRQEMMLTKFAWSSDASAVASDAVKASGSVTKSFLDAQVQQQTTNTTNVRAAEDAVRTAGETVRLEEARVETLRIQGAAAVDINKEQLTLGDAHQKLITAEQALATARQRSAALSPTAATVDVGNSGNIGSTNIAETPPAGVSHLVYTLSGSRDSREIYGPVLYAIRERRIPASGGYRDTVFLRAIETHVNGDDVARKQRLFPTNAPDVQIAAANSLTLTPFGTPSVGPDKDGRTTVVFTLSAPVKAFAGGINISPKLLDGGTRKPLPAGSPAPSVSFESKTSFRVDLTGLAPGIYEFTLLLEPENGGPQRLTLQVRVQPSKAP